MFKRAALLLGVAGLAALCGCTASSLPCTPACTHGFECVDGACVSQCHPACPQNTLCDLLGRCIPVPPDMASSVDASVARQDMSTVGGGDSGRPAVDMAVVQCAIPAGAPVKLAALAPEGGLLSGDRCRVLYRDGTNLRDVRSDGTADALVLPNADPQIHTLVSPDRSMVGVCDTTPSCFLHRMGGGNTPLFQKLSLAAGAFASDGSFLVAVGRTVNTATLFHGAPSGPFIMKGDATDPAWVAASGGGTVYALSANGPSSGMFGVTLGDLNEWKADGSSVLLGSQTATSSVTPAITPDGIFFSALTVGDVGHLRFRPVRGGNLVDFAALVQAHLGIFPVPDGKRVAFFRNQSSNPIQVSFDVGVLANMASMPLTKSVLQFRPSFAADGAHVLLGDGCDQMKNLCSFVVQDVSAPASRVTLGVGSVYAPMFLSASGQFAFIGDGTRVFDVQKNAVVYTGVGTAFDAVRSADGKRIAWVEKDPQSAMLVTHVLDEAVPGAVPVADASGMPTHALGGVGESAGALLYTQSDANGLTLRAYVTATHSFVTVASHLGSAPLDISPDGKYGVYSGADGALYVVALP